MGIRYPIVMDRWMFCTGQCKKQTKHEVKVYPDTEYQRCTVCDHKQQVRYDREIPTILKPADRESLEGILSDLSQLSNEVGTRNWGHLGKKDSDFIDRTVTKINAISRRVRRLIEE